MFDFRFEKLYSTRRVSSAGHCFDRHGFSVGLISCASRCEIQTQALHCDALALALSLVVVCSLTARPFLLIVGVRLHSSKLFNRASVPGLAKLLTPKGVMIFLSSSDTLCSPEVAHRVRSSVQSSYVILVTYFLPLLSTVYDFRNLFESSKILSLLRRFC